MTWAQVGNDINGTAVDYLGRVTAISSDGSLIAAVNDLNYFDTLNIYSNNNNDWAHMVELKSPEVHQGIGNVHFASNGNIVAFTTTGNGRVRKVRLYKKLNNSWEYFSDLNVTTSQYGGGYDMSISSDAQTVAVSDTQNGSVYVYKYNQGNGNWSIDWDIVGYIPNSGPSISLSSNGSVLAIANDKGDLKVYQRPVPDINGSWIQIGSTIEGIGAGYLVGPKTNISISSNGDRWYLK